MIIKEISLFLIGKVYNLFLKRAVKKKVQEIYSHENPKDRASAISDSLN
jgi:hypothetical protein